MDVDFLVQDTFALSRPHWKLAATFEEAGAAFAEMVEHNYKSQEQERPIEAEQPDEGASSDEDADDDDDLPAPDADDAPSSGEEVEQEAESEVKGATLNFPVHC